MSHSSAWSMRLARPLVVLALGVALASCGSDNPSGIAPSWTLQTVEGAALPFTVPNASHDIVITSATARLGSDNSYTMTFTGTIDGVAGPVATDAGTWTVSSSVFTFRSSDLGGQTYVGAYLRNSFRAQVPGVIFGSSTESFNMLFVVVQ